MKFIFLALTVLLGGNAFAYTDFSGHWEGMCDHGEGVLPLTIEIEHISKNVLHVDGSTILIDNQTTEQRSEEFEGRWLIVKIANNYYWGPNADTIFYEQNVSGYWTNPQQEFEGKMLVKTWIDESGKLQYRQLSEGVFDGEPYKNESSCTFKNTL